MKVRAVRGAAAGGLAAVALLCAAPAWADVSVVADTPVTGTYAVVTLNVSNTRQTAAVTAVEVTVPIDSRTVTVTAGQQTGWDIDVRTSGAGSTAISWQASGASLPPGQFLALGLMIGPLPAQPSLPFSTVETYSDGDQVRWDQVPTANEPTPPRPAPVLALSAQPVSAVAGPDTAGSGGGGGTDGVARLLSTAAVLIGLVACGIAVTNRRGHPPAMPLSGPLSIWPSRSAGGSATRGPGVDPPDGPTATPPPAP